MRHLPNVQIILIEDKAASKEEYNTDYYWEKGSRDIKAAIGKPIDAVFCGSDYLGTNRFESLYCPERYTWAVLLRRDGCDPVAPPLR